MRKLLTTIAIFTTLLLSAQDHGIYVSGGIGPYLNYDFKHADAWGYSAEIGYCYDNTVNAGISYGTLDLPNTAPYLQARTGYVFLDKPRFSMTASTGLGYVFNLKQLIGEGDLTANVHIKKGWDFTVTFANQGVYSLGYLPSINLGFCKYFQIKPKK